MKENKGGIVLEMNLREEWYGIIRSSKLCWLFLNLDEKPIDFSEFTGWTITEHKYYADLLSLDELMLSELELNKRQLTERYFSMRKSPQNLSA